MEEFKRENYKPIGSRIIVTANRYSEENESSKISGVKIIKVEEINEYYKEVQTVVAVGTDNVYGLKVGDKVRISLSNYPLIGYEEKPFQKKDKVVESQLKGFAPPSVTLDGEQCLEIYQADIRAILS